MHFGAFHCPKYSTQHSTQLNTTGVYRDPHVLQESGISGACPAVSSFLRNRNVSVGLLRQLDSKRGQRYDVQIILRGVTFYFKFGPVSGPNSVGNKILLHL